MKLYTKNNCSACEEVKNKIVELQLPVEIQIVNVTNDLVKVMQIKEKLTLENRPMTFPVLETDEEKLLNPSAKIIEFLNFIDRAKGVEANHMENPIYGFNEGDITSFYVRPKDGKNV